MNITHIPKGVCPRKINIVLDEKGEIVKEVFVVGGCHGGGQGLAALSKDRPVAEVIERLKGIECGDKGTSCPDQIATALLKV